MLSTVTSDLQVREFADQALLLDADSDQVVIGTPEQVFEHPAFRRRYGDFASEARHA